MDVNFVWKKRDQEADIIQVELLLVKAQSVFTDPFANYEKLESVLDSDKTSGHLRRTPMRQAVESNIELYAITIHDLPLGIYHYMFLVHGKEKEWLEISEDEKVTMLGSMRKVNYIELDPTSPKSIISYSERKY